MNILILGSTGMIGHKLYEVLSRNNNFRLFNISKSKLIDDTKIVDLRYMNQIEEILDYVRPDVVINAAGILIEDSQSKPLDAVLINTVLPLSLNLLSKKIRFKLIQISTDCVFSGDTGPYQVDDSTDAKNIYGKTKALGEISDHINLTIRTSVIGPDLKKDGKELLNWFVQQSGSIKGFTKSIWSGVTTLELAKCIEHCIVNNIGGIHHLSSGTQISKYDLLSLLNNYLANKIDIKKTDGPVTNKVLLNKNNCIYYINKTYKLLIEEMVNDIIESKNYPHYKLFKNSH